MQSYGGRMAKGQLPSSRDRAERCAPVGKPRAGERLVLSRPTYLGNAAALPPSTVTTQPVVACAEAR
jgi:hypothetical protein